MTDRAERWSCAVAYPWAQSAPLPVPHLGLCPSGAARGDGRLLVRERCAYTQRRAPFLVEPVAVVAFMMSERMLRGIRDRAGAGRPTV